MVTHPKNASKKVIAFDFDGTLTYKDSFIAFLTATQGKLRIASTMALNPLHLLDYVKTKDRGALKARLLHNLLGDISQRELETLINAFVTKTGMSLFRQDALLTWEQHSQTDRMRVIVTASPEILVRPFGKILGADRVIGTKLKFTDDHILLPELDGLNCRGEEKMCRLRATFGHQFELDSAYGDTRGDREMLAAAQNGYYRVFKARP